MTEIVLHGARAAGARRPHVGYAMASAAAVLFALNSGVSKVILTESELTSLRLTELRATGPALLEQAELVNNAHERARARAATSPRGRLRIGLTVGSEIPVEQEKDGFH